MNRRQLFKAVAVLAPASTCKIEPEVSPSDLVVIEYQYPVPFEVIVNVVTSLKQMLPEGTRVLVLEGGAKFSVHRGIARVEGLHHV